MEDGMKPKPIFSQWEYLYHGRAFAPAVEERADCSADGKPDANNVLNDLLIEFLLRSTPVLSLEDELRDEGISVIENRYRDGDECQKGQRRKVQVPEEQEHKGQNSTDNAREEALLPLQDAADQQDGLPVHLQVMLGFVENFFLQEEFSWFIDFSSLFVQANWKFTLSTSIALYRRIR